VRVVTAGPGVMSLDFAYLADRPEAIPQIAQWWFDEWGRFAPGETVEDVISQINAVLSRDKVPLQLVAVMENAVVGVAALELHEMFDLYPEKHFWLGSVVVPRELRGRGIGSALAMKITEIAREKGIQAVHLQTENLNGGLYAMLGWERIEHVHYQGRDVLVMVKHLENQ